jgi:hypothetical protein
MRFFKNYSGLKVFYDSSMDDDHFAVFVEGSEKLIMTSNVNTRSHIELSII